MNDSYNENYKICWKKLNRNKWKYIPVFIYWKTSYHWNVHTMQNYLQSQCNPIELGMLHFAEIFLKNSKIHIKMTSHIQSNLKKKQSWMLHIS